MRGFLKYTLMVLTWLVVGGAIVYAGVRWSGAAAIVLGAVALLVPFAYILVCTFYPSWGDMRCPRCGRPALRRPDPGNPVGVVCDACGYEDRDLYRAYLDEMQ